MNNSAIGHRWDEIRGELYSPEENAESDLRVALAGELVKTRSNTEFELVMRRKKGEK